jgi:hypothetical protein
MRYAGPSRMFKSFRTPPKQWCGMFAETVAEDVTEVEESGAAPSRGHGRRGFSHACILLIRGCAPNLAVQALQRIEAAASLNGARGSCRCSSGLSTAPTCSRTFEFGNCVVKPAPFETCTEARSRLHSRVQWMCRNASVVYSAQ